jgi:orotidine-5'-phosphate decarboxylase
LSFGLADYRLSVFSDFTYLRRMTRQQLVDQIFQKQSYLCVGLDTDLTKIPKHLQVHPDAIFEFNKAIIDATKDHCVSYKINTAFYEAMGLKGWEAMERTVNYIPSTHFKIADAKRGDIGNTSTQYAKAFFETMNFDAITVAPYMGEDSVRPFLEYEDKWTIVLGLTSNKGANDFELKQLLSENGEEHLRAEFLYERVLRTVSKWGNPGNLMFVVGATQAEEFVNIRTIIPEHFLLVPGVGAQGGSLKDISEKASNKDCGLLVNASRAVIYASGKEDFADEAKAIAEQYQFEMKGYL